jgi:hypothetical protein
LGQRNGDGKADSNDGNKQFRFVWIGHTY